MTRPIKTAGLVAYSSLPCTAAPLSPSPASNLQGQQQFLGEERNLRADVVKNVNVTREEAMTAGDDKTFQLNSLQLRPGLRRALGPIRIRSHARGPRQTSVGTRHPRGCFVGNEAYRPGYAVRGP
jgi:hypothetical protein